MSVIRRAQNKARATWYHSARWRAHLIPRSRISAQRMIFVVGSYNSGTTLIGDYICQSQDYGGLQTEGDSLVPRMLTPEKLGYSRYPTACIDAIDTNTQQLAAEDAAWAQRIWTAAAVPKSRRSIFVEKSISNGLRLNWLAEHFPDAVFIWVKRNPYCCAEGMLRRSQENRRNLKPLSNIQTAFAQWQLINSRIASFFSRAPRGGVIYYEEFTAHQTEAILPILEQSGCPIHASQVRSYSFHFHGIARAIENDNPKSLARLTAAQIDDINALYAGEIAAAGYDVVNG